MKRALMAYFVLVLVVMSWVTVTASMDRDLLTAAAEIWADPWGKATLFDAYLAFFTVFLWIAYREPSWPKRFLWLVLIALLGNFAIAVYFLLALARLPSEEPWTALFRRPTA